MAPDDTIVAVSSAPGSSAVALVRLSGTGAIPCVRALVVEGRGSLDAATRWSGVKVVLEAARARVAAWVQVYKAPLSYTREDMAEVILPGSTPLVGLVTKALLQKAGSTGEGEGAGGAQEPRGRVRWARAGEFTLRAFLNGRIDLSEAEAVASLISSGGEEEARASRRALKGELAGVLGEIGEGIIALLGLVEAALDFPDEDLPDVAPRTLGERAGALLLSIERLKDSTALRMPSDGTLRVVLAGLPNAGKSSLLNALVGRRAAITSDLPGTTRDPVRGTTVHSGRRVEWIDIAGSRATDWLAPDRAARSLERPCGVGVQGAWREDPILEAVHRLSRREIENADRVLWVVDSAADTGESLDCYSRLDVPSKLLVFQKIDLLGGDRRSLLSAVPGRPVLVSARTGEGLTGLVERVLAPLGEERDTARRPVVDSSPRFLVSVHQDVALSAARDSLSRARDALATGTGLEYAALDLRDALRALEDVTGANPRDAVLDWIFSRFCIGK